MKQMIAGLFSLLIFAALGLPAPAAQEEACYTFTFAGDCTFGCTPEIYYAQMGFIKTVGDDYDYPFRNVRTYFEDDDLTVVNLEGPLTDVGGRVEKTYNFRGPPEYAQILTRGSVEAVSVANNHTLDYGPKGYAATLETLDRYGIPYVERDAGRLITLPDGLKVGLYGMVYYRYPTAEELRAAFAELKEQGAQVIIFLPHWGVEYSYTPNEVQIQTAHDAIDAGANIVCGSHPHVLQSIERYNGGIIYYSLGNFSFGGNADPGDYDTALIRQTLRLDETGRVRLDDPEAVPACVSSTTGWNNYQPTPYPEQSEGYARVMEKLGLAETAE